MTEEEVNYASVVFRPKKGFQRQKEKEEEPVYDEVKVQDQPIQQASDKNVSAGILPDKNEDNKRHHCWQLACCLGIICVVLLLGVIAVCVYLTLSHKSEQKKLNKNITSLLAANQNLTNLNHNLSSENEKLKQDHNKLTVQLGNQTQAYLALESKITQLNAENQNFTTQIQKLNTKNKQLNTKNKGLETQNQELNTKNKELETQNGELDEKKQKLEREKDGLTKTIQDMVTNWNINVKEAEWSIDAYCPKQNDNRRCKPCQKGWLLSQSSCYAINDAQPAADQKTWDEAREDCKGKISDLAVIDNQDDKTFLSDNSWRSSGTKGYWIGLRAEDGKWKWVDGTDLTETSWIQQRPTDGHCAISVHNEGWKSVNCREKQMSICGKATLFV